MPSRVYVATRKALADFSLDRRSSKHALSLSLSAFSSGTISLVSASEFFLGFSLFGFDSCRLTRISRKKEGNWSLFGWKLNFWGIFRCLICGLSGLRLDLRLFEVSVIWSVFRALSCRVRSLPFCLPEFWILDTDHGVEEAVERLKLPAFSSLGIFRVFSPLLILLQLVVRGLRCDCCLTKCGERTPWV